MNDIRVERLNVLEKTFDRNIVEQLYSLMEYGYNGMKRDVFLNDFFKKDIVFVVQTEGKIVGFSTLAVRSLRSEKNSTTLFYSGDTMVLKEFWGKSNLHMHIINYIKKYECDEKVYALTSMHPRTYFIIKYAFRNEITPCVGSSAKGRQLYDQLCQSFTEIFPEKNLERAGNYMKINSNYHVSENIMQLSQREAQREKWSEYREINPGFERGDEILSFHRLPGA